MVDMLPDVFMLEATIALVATIFYRAELSCACNDIEVTALQWVADYNGQFDIRQLSYGISLNSQTSGAVIRTHAPAVGIPFEVHKLQRYVSCAGCCRECQHVKCTM